MAVQKPTPVRHPSSGRFKPHGPAKPPIAMPMPIMMRKPAKPAPKKPKG